MAHTDTWNAAFKASPADGDAAALGDDEIRTVKRAVEERLALDHSMAGDDDDGLHKKATLIEQASDPASVANRGLLYTKDVSGITELFYRDSAGTIKQITSDGVIPGELDFSTGNAGQLATVSSTEDGPAFWVLPDYMSRGFIKAGTDPDHDLLIYSLSVADSTGARILTLPVARNKLFGAGFGVGYDQGGMAAKVTKTGTFTTVTTAVTGIGTLFASEFAVGDILYSSSNAEYRRITAIASNIAMTLTSAYTADVSSAEAVQKNGLAPSSTYSIFAIHRLSDGVVDIYADSSDIATEIPSGFEAFRKIGVFDTDGSGNIDTFMWYTAPHTMAGSFLTGSLTTGSTAVYAIQHRLPTDRCILSASVGGSAGFPLSLDWELYANIGGGGYNGAAGLHMAGPELAALTAISGVGGYSSGSGSFNIMVVNRSATTQTLAVQFKIEHVGIP